MSLNAKQLQYQHYIATVLRSEGCPQEIDFGQFELDGCGDWSRREGRMELSGEQLSALIAKLGSCSSVTKINLGGEATACVTLLLCRNAMHLHA